MEELRFYDEALSLLPEDPFLKCRAADAAWRLDDRSPMHSLREQPEARYYRGRGYFELGLQVPDAKDRGAYYQRALIEYRQAIAREPRFIEALNEYAYVTWAMRVASVHVGDAQLQRAEAYARRALNLVSGGRAPSSQVHMVRSTLGEVLLAQGRFVEALDELRAALDVLGYTHARHDEVRWDLAQANLCLAHDAFKRSPTSNDEGRRHLDAAAYFLAQVRQNDEIREERLLPESLLGDGQGAYWVPPVCRVERPPFKTSSKDAPVLKLQLVQALAAGASSCGPLVVSVNVKPEAARFHTRLYLHLWGCGVDRHLEVSDGSSVLLLPAGRPGQVGRFHAQLKGADGKPLSTVQMLGAAVGAADGGSPEGVLTLSVE